MVSRTSRYISLPREQPTVNNSVWVLCTFKLSRARNNSTASAVLNWACAPAARDPENGTPSIRQPDSCTEAKMPMLVGHLRWGPCGAFCAFRSEVSGRAVVPHRRSLITMPTPNDASFRSYNFQATLSQLNFQVVIP
jgi:hypothetical protein